MLAFGYVVGFAVGMAGWYGYMGFILISVTQGRQRVTPTFIAARHSLYMREYG